MEVTNSFDWFQNVPSSYFDLFLLFEPIYLIFQNVQRCRKKVFLAMEELNSECVIFVCLFVCHKACHNPYLFIMCLYL